MSARRFRSGLTETNSAVLPLITLFPGLLSSSMQTAFTRVHLCMNVRYDHPHLATIQADSQKVEAWRWSPTIMGAASWVPTRGEAAMVTK